MLTIEQLRSDYKPQITALAEQFGVANLRVFGSVARGEVNEDSDIDFLFSRKEKTDLLDLSGLHWRLENLLKMQVQLVDENSVIKYAYPDEREHIFKEALPL